MALSGAIFSQQPAGAQQSVSQQSVFSVVASPAEDTRNSMNLSWGIDLTLGTNNHIYVSTHPLSHTGNPQKTGTIYIQTTSSDNERGVECDLSKPLEFNADKIKFRWSEGPQTVSGMYMKVSRKKLTLVLLNRHGEVPDTTEIFAKKKTR